MASIVITMDGTLLNWLKNVGDSVKAGDVVAEVEADKATVEITAPEDGVISELKAQPGDELKEGTVIGTIGGAGAAAPVAEPAQPAQQQAAAPAQQQQAPSPTGNGKASVTAEGRVKASPVARNIAADRGIDLVQVQGTGPGGRIVKSDVENFKVGAPARPADAPQSAPAAGVSLGAAPARKMPEGPDVEIIDVTKMRSRIAASTVESKQFTPHFYVTSEMQLDSLLELRKQINANLSEEAKVTVNDLIVKAAALALHKFPNLNTHYYGDKLVRHKHYNIGIAVALPNGGLINVVARDADKVSLSTMAQQNKEMIARAREGKVKPEDIQGSTFTVSNLGPYDVDHFIAIINPPEAGILAVGSGKKVPVVKNDGSVGVETRIKITISVDHRVSDGAEGAAYLQELRALIENPMRLLV